jgi:SRSO17 transposase
VWVIDDIGFPKGGPAWACVARQYSGALGKVASRGEMTSAAMIDIAVDLPHASPAAPARTAHAIRVGIG